MALPPQAALLPPILLLLHALMGQLTYYIGSMYYALLLSHCFALLLPMHTMGEYVQQCIYVCLQW